ncbi:putative glutathione S-transferase [Capsicum annuum]|nr:putative glutathione S-transferase [Capsicum annuum]KAF3653048.1 putative glutathione S-transferase [Capsicum annuum]
MRKSIRILLSIVAHYDYEIWQMDVKTAFLNRSLDERIFMWKPDDFIEKGKECMLLLAKDLFSKGEEAEKSNEEFSELLKILDNELKDKLFFVEAVGVVVTSEKFPNICAWRDNYISCSQVKEHLPSRNELLAYFESRFQAAAAGAPK